MNKEASKSNLKYSRAEAASALQTSNLLKNKFSDSLETSKFIYQRDAILEQLKTMEKQKTAVTQWKNHNNDRLMKNMVMKANATNPIPKGPKGAPLESPQNFV